MGFDILQYSTSVDCDPCEGGVNRGGTVGGENEDGGAGGAGGAGNTDGGAGDFGKVNGDAVAIPATPKFKARVEAIAVNNFFIGLCVDIYKI